MRRTLDWNGRDLPALLRELPPGRYCLEDQRDCTRAEQEALRQLAAREEDLPSCD
jgi:hypothetical protein